MYISIRDFNLIQAFGGIKTGFDAIDVDAVELEYFKDMSVNKIDSISSEKTNDFESIKNSGIKISTLLLHNNFACDDLDAEIEWVISAVRQAEMLEADSIRIDAIMSNETTWSLSQRVSKFADSMKRVLDACSDTKLEMGIENHGVQGNDPDFIDKVLDDVGDSRVGLTIDTANFYWFGHSLSRVHEIIEYFAARVKHTHMKNINYPSDMRESKREMGYQYEKFASSLRDGDLDIARIVKALNNAGYKKDLCIENESLFRLADKQEQQKALIDDASYLREIIEKI